MHSVVMMMMMRRLVMTSHCSNSRTWLLLLHSAILLLTIILVDPQKGRRTASAWVLLPKSTTTTTATRARTTSCTLSPCSSSSSSKSNTRQRQRRHDDDTCRLFAGGRKNRRSSSSSRTSEDNDQQDLDRWYQAVEPDASPDDIFWEEMERQRLLAKIGQGGDSGSGSSSSMDGMSSSSSSNYASMSSSGSSSPVLSGSFGGGGSGSATTSGYSSSFQQQQQQSLDKTNSLLAMASMSYTGVGGGGQQQSAQNSAEATLSQYASYAVADNWLDDDLVWMMKGNDDMYQHDDEDVKSLDEQLEAWESHEDHDDEDDEDDEEDTAWMQSDEPWDSWDEKRGKTLSTAAAGDDNSNNPVLLSTNNRASAYLLNVDEDGNDDNEDEEAAAAAAASEEEYQRRLGRLKLSSRRLEHARNNSKAAAFFSRQPDTESGYDRLWVSAIDNVCFKSLVGLARNYGIEFADNFGDWQDGCMEDSMATIEDIASFKARQVYNVTGLPCIASRTSFEVEPIPMQGGQQQQQQQPLGRSAIANINPRVASGYRFNDIGLHVDYICDALRPLSEPSRVTSFKSCLCYYDGQMEVFDYGVCDVDLYFSNSLRTFIPMSQAIQEMIKTLELTFGLEYQSWVEGRTVKVATAAAAATAEKSLTSAAGTTRSSSSSTSILGPASLKLRDRVLKDGKVLPNNIIDVSAFMDSLVDVNLMDECAKELYQRFADLRPTKILTVATTGLVIALPMAKYLQVPVVYARKERSVTMADTYKAGYSSKTVGKSRELIVSKSHLGENDRILIVDDFLSSGASQEALLRIVSSCPGATAVGIGVLLEKVFDSGRQSLSGFNVPIHSLCKIASVDNQVIQLEEEEGFDRMKRQKQTQK